MGDMHSRGRFGLDTSRIHYSQNVGAGLVASWYNQQFYWGVQVSNLTQLSVARWRYGNSCGVVVLVRPWKLINDVAADTVVVVAARWFPVGTRTRQPS